MAPDDGDLPDDVSMGGSDDGDELQTMTAELAATFDEYYDAVTDADDAGEAMNLALDAGSDFAALVVAADDEDRTRNLAKSYLNQIADAKSALGRKDIRAHWEDEIETKEKAATVADGVPTQFEELFIECLADATKTVVSDKKKNGTEYELEFNDGVGTTLAVSESTVMSHEAMWKAYASASGQYPVQKDDASFTDKSWRNKIGPVLEEIETVESEIGPCTAAWKSVKNIIERSRAYTDMGDAVEQGGMWVGDVEYDVKLTDEGTHDIEEQRTVRELRVMREDIAQVTSQHDVTDRALQIELKARDVASPRVNGISDSTYVNGSWQTYWCFDLESEDVPDLDDDAIYDDVEDGMDRLADQDSDDDDDVEDVMDRLDDEDTGDDDEDEDDDDGDSSAAGDDSDGGDGPDSGDDDRMPGGGAGKIGESGAGAGGDGE